MLDFYLKHNSGGECPMQFHRWSFISGVAASLGRRVWLPFGDENIFPAMYVALVGVPATKKSTAIKKISKLLKTSGYNSFAFNNTSRAQFLIDYEARAFGGESLSLTSMKDLLDVVPDDSPNECFIAPDEGIDFFKIKNYEFLVSLMALWDQPDSYPERLKHSKHINIIKPTTNMLTGFTPSSLSLVVPQEMIGQGLTSRMIFVHAERMDARITIPPRTPEHVETTILDFFKEIRNLSGPVTFSDDGYTLIDSIYRNFRDLSDSRLQHYCSRRFIQLLKLCQVLAVCKRTKLMTYDIVEEANTILTFTESNMGKAFGEFGESRHAKATQKIMETLENADRPLSILDLWKAVSQDVEKMLTLNEILQGLLRSEKIIQSNSEEETTLIINREIDKQNTTGVNFEKWLPEYR